MDFFSVEYVNLAVTGLIIYVVALDFFKDKKRVHCGITYIPNKEMKYWEWARDALFIIFAIIENNILPVSTVVYNYLGLGISVLGFLFFQYYYKHLADMLREMYRKDPKKLARIIDKPQIVFYGYLLFSVFILKHMWYFFR